MASMSKIKGILFDYGGTLDSRAQHWSEIIWQGYCSVNAPVSKEFFREAYVYAERFLGREPIVKPNWNFIELMHAKIDIQAKYLESNYGCAVDNQPFVDAVAKYCYDKARECVEESKNVLDELKENYQLGVVSNFYGNLKAVMADFGVLDYFQCVIESAVVGIRKPDSEIFRCGVNALNLTAEEVLVVGDNYEKDIVPAMQIGCDVVWYEGVGWETQANDGISVKKVHNLADLRKTVLAELN